MQEIIVRAGAGAGKTTRLTSHVFDVAEKFKAENGRFPNLVVTTFTRKATQELRERLILKACEKNELELIEYASSPSKLFITTIHGVLGQFLRRYGHLIGVDNSYSLISNQQIEVISKKLLREIIQNHAEFYSLVETFEYRSLTQLMKQYYQGFMSNPELKPLNIDDFKSDLMVQMSEWAQVLSELCDSVKESSDDKKWITWATELEAVISELEKPYQEDFALHVQDRLAGLSSKPRANKKNPSIDPEVDEKVKEIMKQFKLFLSSPLCDETYWPDFEAHQAMLHKLGQKFVSKYSDYKKALGQLEMADLELIAYKAILENPEVAAAFSDEWDYWLIDEYQDTSPIQVDLLTQLVGKSNSFTVGDPQQSIYFFRGAENLVFEEKQNKVRDLGGLVDKQTKNYRSDPELLCFFNDFFSRLDGFEPMQPRSEEIDASKTVATITVIDDGEKAKESELSAMASNICELIKAGVKFEDICILSKTNQDLVDIAWYLNQFNLPTHVHASGGFSTRRETLDFLQVIKFLINPHDNETLIGLLRSPWFYLDEEIVLEKLNLRDKNSYWLQIVEPLKEQAPIKKLIEALGLKKREGVLEATKQTLFDMAFVDTSLKYDPTGRRESNIWKLVSHLTEEQGKPGFSFLDYVNSTIETINEEVDEDSDAVAALEPNRINLMTIHASKGLEFDHVFVPFMHKRPNLTRTLNFQYDRKRAAFGLSVPLGDDGKRITSISGKTVIDKIKNKELEELDRWLYVALTRAKRGVYLSWNSKTLKDSWADRINWDLEAGIHKTKNYSIKVTNEIGDPKPIKPVNENINTLRKKFILKNDEKDLGVKYSVSSILDADSSLKFEKTKKQLPLIIEKTQMGVDLHRCLEVLKYQFEFDFSKVAKSWFSNKADDVLSAVEYVKNLKEPNISELLKTAEVEWGFQLLTDKGIMEGQIDLWGVDASGTTWVIDYKSGSEKYSDRAFKQLEYYAQALKEYGQPTPIKLAIIYPLTKSVKVQDF